MFYKGTDIARDREGLQDQGMSGAIDFRTKKALF